MMNYRTLTSNELERLTYCEPDNIPALRELSRKLIDAGLNRDELEDVEKKLSEAHDELEEVRSHLTDSSALLDDLRLALDHGS